MKSCGHEMLAPVSRFGDAIVGCVAISPCKCDKIIIVFLLHNDFIVDEIIEGVCGITP